jgi:ankyrin repeat protein
MFFNVFQIFFIALIFLLDHSYQNRNSKNFINLIQEQKQLSVDSRKIFPLDLNYKDYNGYTVLDYIVEKGRVNLVHYFLENGSDPNNVSKEKKTALHLSSIYGMRMITQNLIHFGAKVNIKDNLGKTPLFYAVERGAFPTVRILVRNHTNLMIKDHLGETVLDKAMLYGYDDIALYLIAHSYTLYKQYVLGDLKYGKNFIYSKHSSYQNDVTLRWHLLTDQYRAPNIYKDYLTQIAIPSFGSQFIFRWL